MIHRQTPSQWLEKLLAITLALSLSACSNLKPSEHQSDFTAGSSDADLWKTLAEVQPSNWQHPLNDGASSIDWRLKAIDSATESLDLQTFLWSFDTVGSLVMDHIIRAANRGVKVKLLIDDTFLAGKDDVLLYIHEHPNIQYRIFNPYKRRSDNLVTRMLLNLGEFARLDHRMHNKSMIVDDRVAIIGGRNLADEYFGLHGQANFRDMELIVGGPIVQEITQSFDDYWNSPWSISINELSHIATNHAKLDAIQDVVNRSQHIHSEPDYELLTQQWLDLVNSAFTGTPVLLVDKPPTKKPDDIDSQPIQVANELIELFEQAQSEILIVSAYLIPTPRMEGAVKRAEERGTHVRILTNSLSSNNHLAAHSSYQNHVEELMGHGANLHEVRTDAELRKVYMFPPLQQKSLALHAKMLIIDHDKVFIGSANLDPRSLRLNTEMGLLVESEALNTKIREMVLPDFSHANAWELDKDENGELIWVSEDDILYSQPNTGLLQRIEDWFISHLPIEGEM